MRARLGVLALLACGCAGCGLVAPSRNADNSAPPVLHATFWHQADEGAAALRDGLVRIPDTLGACFERVMESDVVLCLTYPIAIVGYFLGHGTFDIPSAQARAGP
jgi:hypothetical protein